MLESVIGMIPEPEPYEIPWADRIEDSDTSLPLVEPPGGDHYYLSLPENQAPKVVAPVYEPPPCRGCGPPRHYYPDSDTSDVPYYYVNPYGWTPPMSFR